MNYKILILLLFVSIESFGQSDSIKSPKLVHIRLGRPANDNYQPLYILDGKPIDDKYFQKMKPETIESITVLKDSAATALYGSKAIDGVIIITTKKSPKESSGK